MIRSTSMRVRIRKHEAELIAMVLRERINLMKHAGVRYNDTLNYRILYDKIRQQVRCEESKKRMGRVR